MRGIPYVSILFLALVIAGCGEQAQPESPLFTLLPADSTGIHFVNEIIEDEGFNVLEYEYFYNGGGVAAGDVDGNGLPDLFFTANIGPERLYLNRGNMRFEDVTEQAGIVNEPSWTTGVTMADVNGDGWLDIYVCKSGRVSEDRRRNDLYINNGDGTFTERSTEYGLDDASYSTHATFFDYDRDGDLDLFLLNHPIRRFARFDAILIRQQRDPLSGDKLFRNDGNRFTNVTEEAGIIGNPLGFGLSAIPSDLNQDGWPDLYITNDYIEDDYFYLNNGDGTFTETLRSSLTHTSYSAMGSDIADFNNDGLPDIVTLDMIAQDNYREKLFVGPESFPFYRQMRERGYTEQYVRNMLHLNNGDGTYSEIGELAGIAQTDWSWASLFVDVDLDGLKDIFITNGYLRDYTNLDFLDFTLRKAFKDAASRGQSLSSLEMVSHMPSTPLVNYLFHNEDSLRFRNLAPEWGLGQASYSNGAVYVDLDNDGDPDLVVNNINQKAFVYRNEAAQQTQHHFLKVRLDGDGANRFGIGAKVELTTEEGDRFFQEMIPTRGYQSSIEPALLFGLGEVQEVDVRVVWNDGRVESRSGVPADQTITFRQGQAVFNEEPNEIPRASSFLFAVPDGRGIVFTHRENAFFDFEREPLLPHMLSRLGPALARSDVNQDGLEDVFLGGAHGQAASLFFQQADGSFRPLFNPDIEAHRGYEDVDALFLDADGDRDLDLYVVSGGNSVEGEDPTYQDRLYRNNGFGLFTYDPEALPEIRSSGGAVAAHDFDGDGDLDLFVGGRTLPGRYPFPPRSYLLENRNGRFVDVTKTFAETLMNPGMITDVLWADLDGDGTRELVLSGEWMPIRIFQYGPSGTFNEVTGAYGFRTSNGWWNTVVALDLDGDGDTDLVAGNRGLNARMKAAPDEPARVVAADFDRNGSVDAVMSYYREGTSYPVPNREELLEQLPYLEKRFPTHESYARAGEQEIFTPEERRTALTLEAHTFATSLFVNQGNGTFVQRPLPLEAQFAPVRSILLEDLDGDTRPDLILAGNDYTVRPQWGNLDAGRGLILLNRGDLNFEVVDARTSGFYAMGDVRKLEIVSTPAGPLLLVARNDAPLSVFNLSSPPPLLATSSKSGIGH